MSKLSALANNQTVIDNPWQDLRRFTDARIAQGRAGVSLPTHELLAFQMDHASARDAVHIPLQSANLTQQLEASGLATLTLKSRAKDRAEYLQRPDLGRRLDAESVQKLNDYCCQNASPVDVAIVIADGLSSVAVQNHAVALTQSIAQSLENRAYKLGPVSVVTQARVALGDEVGELLSARLLILLVGERPGLSSPDSLGIYFTYAPKTGLNDARRNCISNVRPAGMSIRAATDKLIWLIETSERICNSGVELKDQSESVSTLSTNSNFLLPAS